ncbi:MAG: flavin reductase family protein [Planctomycetaceae bacterium]|nr:flavin reductase family protein [Planctomycetaceae bacterium]
MSELLTDVASVLGRIPSGLFILTAKNADGDETGLLASWVQQAGFDPPMVTVAVNQSRYLNDWLAESPRVAISVVGESQKQYLGHFGRGFEPGESAFEGLDIARTSYGLSVLADCLGWLAGDVTGSLDAGDHRVYAVRVTESSGGPRLADEKPWVHLRKNGLGY